jgi:hypothetical protein
VAEWPLFSASGAGPLSGFAADAAAEPADADAVSRPAVWGNVPCRGSGEAADNSTPSSPRGGESDGDGGDDQRRFRTSTVIARTEAGTSHGR